VFVWMRGRECVCDVIVAVSVVYCVVCVWARALRLF